MMNGIHKQCQMPELYYILLVRLTYVHTTRTNLRHLFQVAERNLISNIKSLTNNFYMMLLLLCYF